MFNSKEISCCVPVNVGEERMELDLKVVKGKSFLRATVNLSWAENEELQGWKSR